MNLRGYTIYSFLFICLIGMISIFNSTGEYTFSFLGFSQTLPTGVWVIVPLIVLYAATLAHMGYYGLVNYLKINSYKSDYDTLLEVIAQKLLGIEEEREYKNKEFKTLGEFVHQTELRPKSRFKLGETKIDKIVETLHQIVDEKNFVDITRYKLSKENSIGIQNAQNRLNVDPKYAEELLRSCEKPTALCQKAFEIYCGFAELKQIKKIEIVPSKTAVMKIFERFSAAENGLDFDREYAQQLCNLARFEQVDYICLAKLLVRKLNPDDLLELFFILSRDNQEAMGAYIYSNLELEVIERAKELLEQSGDDEFLEYKAFLCLKEGGKSIRLSSFLEQVAARTAA